jgi:hypothetical protein
MELHGSVVVIHEKLEPLEPLLEDHELLEPFMEDHDQPEPFMEELPDPFIRRSSSISCTCTEIAAGTLWIIRTTDHTVQGALWVALPQNGTMGYCMRT